MAEITPERLAQGECEDAQQAALFCWLRHPRTLEKYAQFPSLKCAYAIPNGGFRGDSKQAKITGAKLKATGVLAGVLDVCIPVPNRGAHGLYIEMKYGDGTPTEEQKEFARIMSAAGYWCVLAWTYEEAKQHVVNYLA